MKVGYLLGFMFILLALPVFGAYEWEYYPNITCTDAGLWTTHFDAGGSGSFSISEEKCSFVTDEIWNDAISYNLSESLNDSIAWDITFVVTSDNIGTEHSTHWGVCDKTEATGIAAGGGFLDTVGEAATIGSFMGFQTESARPYTVMNINNSVVTAATAMARANPTFPECYRLFYNLTNSNLTVIQYSDAACTTATRSDSITNIHYFNVTDAFIVSNDEYGSTSRGINYVFDNVTIRKLVWVAPPAPINASYNVSLISPLSGASYNVNVTEINFTFFPIFNSDIENCSLWINDSTWGIKGNLSNVVNGTNNIIKATHDVAGAEGEYMWNVLCLNNMTNETYAAENYTFNLDYSPPSIVINGDNFFSPYNRTFLVNDSVSAVTIDITFLDNHDLYAYEILVFNGSTIVLNETNLTISGTNHRFIKTVDVTAPAAVYSVNITVTDSHTSQGIPDWVVSKTSNSILFDNDVKISADSASSANYEKKFDRYEFGFDYAGGNPPVKTFYVESNSVLTYLPESDYAAHFVDYYNKKWIDFEGGDILNVLKISDKRYRVMVNYIGSSIKFKSIGGLNDYKREYFYTLLAAPSVTDVNGISVDNVTGSDVYGYCQGYHPFQDIGFQYRWYLGDTIIGQGNLTSPCYQGYANLSTACGGVSVSGGYYFSNWNNQNRITDEDYSTSSNTVGGVDAVMEVNYTKHPMANMYSEWMVKDETSIVNLTGTHARWDAYDDIIRMRVDSVWTPSVVRWYIHNGSEYNLLKTGTGNQMYEEGMQWSVFDSYSTGVDHYIHNIPTVGSYAGKYLKFSCSVVSNYSVTDYVNSTAIHMVAGSPLSGLICADDINLCFNITYAINFSRLDVELDSIYYDNLSRSSNLSNASYTLTFNVTDPDANYTGYDLPYVIDSSSNITIMSNLNGSVNLSMWVSNINCSENRIFYKYDDGAQYRVYLNDSFDCANSTLHIWDLNVTKGENELLFFGYLPPTIHLNFTVNTTGFGTGGVNVTVRCDHPLLDSVIYNLTFNGGRLLSQNSSVNVSYSNSTTAVPGTNWAYAVCESLMGDATLNVSRDIYFSVFILIDERNGTLFDVFNISGVKLFYADNHTYFDFQLNNVTNVSFFTDQSTKLRLELLYPDGAVINRFVDVSLFDGNNIRLCANRVGVTHYEQLILAATSKIAYLKNDFANCYVAADYTRFAYEDALMLKAYTIDSMYSLTTEQSGVSVSLGGVDGSVSSYINLETLEFKIDGFDISLIRDAVGIQKVHGSTTMKITYLNVDNNSEDLALTITNMDDNSQLFYKDDFSNNNEFTLYWDYSAVAGVTNSTIFRLTLDRTQDGEVNTLTRYFNINGSTGIISTGAAVIATIILTIFGLSLAISRTTFSWFGLIICIGCFVILSLAIPAWYITFFQVLQAIIFLYIFVTMINLNSKTVT